jgi:hypothetical protein
MNNNTVEDDIRDIFYLLNKIDKSQEKLKEIINNFVERHEQQKKITTSLAKQLQNIVIDKHTNKNILND